MASGASTSSVTSSLAHQITRAFLSGGSAPLPSGASPTLVALATAASTATRDALLASLCASQTRAERAATSMARVTSTIRAASTTSTRVAAAHTMAVLTTASLSITHAEATPTACAARVCNASGITTRTLVPASSTTRTTASLLVISAAVTPTAAWATAATWTRSTRAAALLFLMTSATDRATTMSVTRRGRRTATACMQQLPPCKSCYPLLPCARKLEGSPCSVSLHAAWKMAAGVVAVPGGAVCGVAGAQWPQQPANVLWLVMQVLMLVVGVSAALNFSLCHPTQGCRVELCAPYKHSAAD